MTFEGSEGNGVEGIDLEPEQFLALERTRNPEHALCGEIEVEVDDRFGLAGSSLVERLEQPDEARLQLRRGIAVEPVAVEARHQHLRFVAGNDDVRLERLEAALDDLAA